jgi:hypothetical protein
MVEGELGHHFWVSEGVATAAADTWENKALLKSSGQAWLTLRVFIRSIEPSYGRFLGCFVCPKQSDSKASNLVGSLPLGNEYPCQTG